MSNPRNQFFSTAQGGDPDIPGGPWLLACWSQIGWSHLNMASSSEGSERPILFFWPKMWNTGSGGRVSDQEIKSVIVVKCFQIMLWLVFLWSHGPRGWLSWLKQGANNARVVGLIPAWAIHLGVRLNDPCGSFPTQTIWWSCESMFSWASLHLVSYCHGIMEWLGLEEILKVILLHPLCYGQSQPPLNQSWLFEALSNLVFSYCCFEDPYMKRKF